MGRARWRVRVRVTVADGGTAELAGLGAGAGAAATTGPTSVGGSATLEVTGTALTGARLTGTGGAVLGAEVEQPFEPVPASGPLRLTRGVLPPAAGPATHSVDVAAYDGTALAGHRITWTDARTPSVGGDYHVFAPGTSIRDGRTARVYGGVATTLADGWVDLFAGGTVGILPRPGVMFRLVGAGRSRRPRAGDAAGLGVRGRATGARVGQRRPDRGFPPYRRDGAEGLRPAAAALAARGGTPTCSRLRPAECPLRSRR